jgi:NTE family protein
MNGGFWCDGGIVDIFPVRPVLDIEEPCEVALALNCFYPPEFAGEDATGWEHRAASILYIASQARTCQQAELARQNLRRLRAHTHVLLVEPVPYTKVQGLGFYRQFLDTTDWPQFMRAGRRTCREALQADANRRVNGPALPRLHKTTWTPEPHAPAAPVLFSASTVRTRNTSRDETTPIT